MQWKVELRAIEWDDGKGEYDVSDLPSELEYFVQADDEDEAIVNAMCDASDEHGSLISAALGAARRID